MHDYARKKPLSLLYIEDNENDFLILGDLLSEIDAERFDLQWVDSYDKGLQALQSELYEVALIDYRLGPRTGLELLQKAVEHGCQTPIIILTGQDDHETDVKAMQDGAADYLVKDQLNAALLERVLRYTIDRHQTSKALQENEIRFRALIENSSDAIALLNPKGVLLYNSDSITRVIGYGKDELQGCSVVELLHPEDSEETLAAFAMLIEHSVGSVTLQYRLKHKDGTWRWIEGIATNLLHQTGVQAVVLNYRDITERKKADQQQQDVGAGLRAVVAAADELLLCPDTDSLLKRAVELAGQTLKLERVGISLLEPDEKYLRGTYGTDLQGQVTDERDFRFRNSGWWLAHLNWQPGGPRWVKKEDEPVLDWDGEKFIPVGKTTWKVATPIQSSQGPVGILFNDNGGSGGALDAVKQELVAVFCSFLGKLLASKQAEAELRESEKRFRLIFDQAALGMALTAMDGRWLRVNPKLCAILGYDAKELQGKIFQEITHPQDLAENLSLLQGAIAGELDTYTMEKRFLRKDGTYLWTNLVVSVARDPAGQLQYLIAAIEDISERKQAKEALRQSEKRFRLVVEQAVDGFFIHDRQGHLIDVNQSACRALGYTREELLQLSVADFELNFESKQVDSLWEKLTAGAISTFTVDGLHLRKDGSSFPVEVHVGLMELDGQQLMLAIARDVSERKKAQQTLQNANEELELRIVERTGELAQANQELRLEITERKRAEESAEQANLAKSE